MRLQQRSLGASALIEGLETLEIIEEYPGDKYLPSYLLRGECKRVVFHTQIATDVEGGNIRVVTIYKPNVGEWDRALRVRRTKS